MFTDLSFLDVNFSLDITQEDVMDAGRCSWFTLPLAVYKVEEDGEEHNVYEYLSFPQTAKGEQHIRFFSAATPYYWNYDYLSDTNTKMGE